MTYLLKNLLLNSRQFGFLPGRSTVLEFATLLHYVNVTLADDPGNYVRSIFLDISKAFNKVWHQGLLQKLAALGIRTEWFKFYLTGWTMCTRVEGVESTHATVLAGVPWGSVLGPLLFLCYVKDVSSSMNTPHFMFADDTTVLIIQNRQTPTKNALAVQTALRDIDQWAKAWLVKFNATKSEDLVITGGKQDSDAIILLS